MSGADLSGHILDGRYKVIEAVAEGAMGVVYRAERLKLGRIVAIKVLHDELPNELSSRKRFEIEAMAMAKLEHPHCTAVLDVGTHEGKPFVVMDFVSGEDLKGLIAAGPVPAARAVEIVRQVLSGLAHAHELGIIHRDIKPANIVLSQKAGLGDHVKVLDFGLARLTADAPKLTTGIVIGTPAYMAPEQIRGKEIDARADLYACGVLLMELLTGKKPFHSEKDDPIEVVSMHLKNPPPKLSDLAPGIDFGELEAIVAKALSKAAADRYQTAQEFVTALEATRSGPIAMADASRSEPVSAASPAVTDSMMIPQGNTRLGLVAVEAIPTSPPSGPVSGVVSVPASGAASGPVPAPLASPTSGPVPVAPSAFLRDDTPLPAPESMALVSPIAAHVVPTRPETDPLMHVKPLDVARLQVGPPNPDGLPYTRRQLAIAGGGLFGLILLISIIAVAARGGGDEKAAVVADAAVGTGEIEMDPVTRDSVDQTIARAQELAGNGERERAIDLLVKARKAYPANADLPYEAGKLYFSKLWWTDGLKSFRDAIRIDPRYQSDPELIKAVLKGFITTPTYNEELGSFLRDDIGADAKPFLEETSREHPNATKRARAAAELKRYP